jgi:acyl-CoA reductase-like NAD-dependent aldehyde dehydrogenase
VGSHGSEVMDIIKPTNRQVIARVTMADEQDTKRAIAAALFVNVKNDMTIAKEEIFGPVLSVIAYASEDEAVKIANDSEYGLHAAVLGTDLQRARRFADTVRPRRDQQHDG